MLELKTRNYCEESFRTWTELQRVLRVCVMEAFPVPVFPVKVVKETVGTADTARGDAALEGNSTSTSTSKSSCKDKDKDIAPTWKDSDSQYSPSPPSSAGPEFGPPSPSPPSSPSPPTPTHAIPTIVGMSALAVIKEEAYLKRCVSLVFQRLARASDSSGYWGPAMLSGMVNLLELVDRRRLCHVPDTTDATDTHANASDTNAVDVNDGDRKKSDSSSSSKKKKDISGRAVEAEENTSSTATLAGKSSTPSLPPAPARIEQTADERQLLSFMLDMIASVRRVAESPDSGYIESKGGTLQGLEREVYRPALRVSLGCLSVVSVNMVDRLCNDILAHLVCMTAEAESEHVSADEFKGELLQVCLCLCLCLCLTLKFSILLASYFMWSGASDSLGDLLSYSVISLAYHLTIILILILILISTLF